MTGLGSKSFSLLWRGSRDGFGSTAFHRLCDGKPNTLTVIKNKVGFIFGGFTAVPWSSAGGYKSDNTAFLFSFTNPTNSPLKLRIKQESTGNAVHHGSSYGPTLGKSPTGDGDLYVSSESNSNSDSWMTFKSYEFPDGKSGSEGGKFVVGGSNNKFQTVEIEVYQIV